MALFLGPAGFGLMGLFNSVADLTQSVVGMGVQSSGVRQIAEAVGAGDARAVATTAAVVRRSSAVLGICGALVLLIFAHPIANATFGGLDQVYGVTLLSLAALFRIVSGGQTALIQGMRRVQDLAKATILGGILGALLSIPLVYVLRERGVVPALIATAGATLFASWWYSRQIIIEPVVVSWRKLRDEASELLKLGATFMATGFMTVAAGYGVRIIVLRYIGLEAAGLYQAAWAVGGLYVGFILQAMGADFYPRLTAVHRDNVQCRRLVNEQVQIGLLLAGPGVLGTLTMAPLGLMLLYSPKFAAAVWLLRWICLGTALQAIAWPMGFIIVAKGARQAFFWTELAATVVHVGLAWLLVGPLGVNGAGVAYFGLYVWHTIVVYAIVRRMSDFRWSSTNRQLGIIFLPLIAGVFASLYVLPLWLGTVVGAVGTAASGMYSAKTLARLLPPEWMPAPVRMSLTRLGMRLDEAR